MVFSVQVSTKRREGSLDVVLSSKHQLQPCITPYNRTTPEQKVRTISGMMENDRTTLHNKFVQYSYYSSLSS